jgi:THO complex subunit 1
MLFLLYSEVVDYVLYTKFWSLQDFFRSPTQCYHDLNWKKFVDVSKFNG